MQKRQKRGLIADLWPNIRLIQFSGLFISEYYDNNSTLMRIIRKTYSWIVAILLIMHYIFMCVYALTESYTANQRASYSVTILFFTHTLIKFMYFSIRTNLFYRTLALWNNPNMHPSFQESDARHRAITVSRMRKLLMTYGMITILATMSWTIITFVGESKRAVSDVENENATMLVDAPRLLVSAWYPWDTMGKTGYMVSLLYQIYFVFIALTISNLCDSLFCSLIIHSSEQLKHVKEIMNLLVELGSTLDIDVPNSGELFKTLNSGLQTPLTRDNGNYETYNENYDYGTGLVSVIDTVSEDGIHTGPNGLTKKQEMFVRLAIKYWVDRHKHIVNYVQVLDNMYGLALVFHMLISTFMMTILAYQATQINGVNVYAFSTIGYLVYTLGQIYMFSIHGSELIEESSSIIQAAYRCAWYNGSEEIKSFIHIVSQQCQKSLCVTGVEFFIVSLDLFSSVLGAAVTYFMLLIQLK